jgi:type I restriction enzyme M protein
VRLYRGEDPSSSVLLPEGEGGVGRRGGKASSPVGRGIKGEGLLAEKFPKGKYLDLPGLCQVATLKEIEAQGWSLNPGRYVGVTERAADDFDFAERLEELNEELEVLNVEARDLEERIAENVAKLLADSSPPLADKKF